MFNKIVGIVFLFTLVLASNIAVTSVPIDDEWVRCVHQCGAEYARCYRTCDVLDDDCWEYCLSSYIMCISLCGDIPPFPNSSDVLRKLMG